MFAGNRLKILRKRKNLTQNDLSDALGYESNYGYKRIGQYEREQRQKKKKTVIRLSELLHVDPSAVIVPDIPSYQAFMQLFFAMEDDMGFAIHKNEEDEFYFTYNEEAKPYIDILPFLEAWHEKGQQLKDNQITKEEYDDWRYTFPASFFTDCICARLSGEAKNKKHFADYGIYVSQDNPKVNDKLDELIYEYVKQHPGKTLFDFFIENPNIEDEVTEEISKEKSNEKSNDNE